MGYIYVTGNVTIANGESLSGAFDLGEKQLVGLIIPSAWTAADIHFQGCMTDGGTFLPLYDDGGTAVLVTGIATGESRMLSVSPGGPQPCRYVKLKSVSTLDATVAVNQAAERSITIITRRFLAS